MLESSDEIAALAPEIARPGRVCTNRECLFADIGEAVAVLPVDHRAARAATLLHRLVSTAGLLDAKERAVPETGYGRTNIYYCPRELFTLVAVVWPAGIVSPIHDHLTWCAFGVVAGEIEETRYDKVAKAVAAAGPEARPRNILRHGPGAVTYLAGGPLDIHAIHNPTADPALTLHVYGGDARKTGPNVKIIYTGRPDLQA